MVIRSLDSPHFEKCLLIHHTLHLGMLINLLSPVVIVVALAVVVVPVEDGGADVTDAVVTGRVVAVVVSKVVHS